MTTLVERFREMREIEGRVLGWLDQRDWDHVWEAMLDGGVADGLHKLVSIVDHMASGGTGETGLLTYWQAGSTADLEWWLRALLALDAAREQPGQPHLEEVYERLLNGDLEGAEEVAYKSDS